MSPQTQTKVPDVASRLRAMSCDELRVLAKELGVKPFRGLRKEELIEALLKLDGDKLARRVNGAAKAPSWWGTYHNHVYGLVTVVALLFGLYAYFYPLLPQPPKNPTPQSILAAMRSLAPGDREAYFNEQYDGKKIRIYGKITGGMSLAGPAANGLSVMTGCTRVVTCDDGTLVWVLFDESQREFVESLQFDTPGSGVIEGIIDGCALGEDKPISVDDDTANMLPFGVKPSDVEEAPDVVLLRQGSFPEITPVKNSDK